MYKLTEADLIWNRACLGNMASLSSPGDQALRGMLSFHNLAMNGGVLHALEVLGPAELEVAKSGYRFFGLEVVADFLGEANSISMTAEDLSLWEVKLDKDYDALVPDDSTLVACFETKLRCNRSEFAPI